MIHSWIVCQIGAREHYAVARALAREGALKGVMTDTWVPPRHPLGLASRRLRERFHPELENAEVWAPNFACAAFELQMRIRRLGGWRRVIARNEWFQDAVVRSLSQVRKSTQPIAIFAYSYAALEILKFARSQGWRTVLGQIDPGPVEERIVSKLHANQTGRLSQWSPTPKSYWERWREECELADRIAVNSAWSKSALEEEGVPEKKIRIVPLAVEPSREAAEFRREYPGRFTAARPLRVLFLGQINLRKGVGPLLDAANLLAGEPVEFWFVGPVQIMPPESLRRVPGVKWFGPVARSETDSFYREADVFAFPTYSDGFGLTQLEARMWKLPLMASRFCGEVVTHNKNGIVLEDITAASIAEALRQFLRDPRLLRNMAQPSPLENFTLAKIGREFRNLFNVGSPSRPEVPQIRKASRA